MLEPRRETAVLRRTEDDCGGVVAWASPWLIGAGLRLTEADPADIRAIHAASGTWVRDLMGPPETPAQSTTRRTWNPIG